MNGTERLNREQESIRQGVLTSFFHIVVSILVAMTQIRLIVSFLPGGQAGTWFVFMSMGALAAYCDLGLGPTISRELSFIIGEKKPDDLVLQRELADLYSTAKRLFRIVAVTVLLAGWVGGSLFLFQVSPQQEFVEIFLAWIVFMLGAAANLWGGAVFAGLYGMGYVAPEKLIRSVSQLFGVLLIYLGLYHGAGLLFLSFVWLLQAVISRWVGWWFLLRRQPFAQSLTGEYQPVLAARLAKSGAWWMLTGAGSILLLQTDQLIVASTIGIGSVPAYEALLKMMTTLSSVSVMLVTSSTPFLSMAFAQGHIRRLRRRVTRIIKWAVVGMLLTGSFVAAMGDKIVALWLGASLFAGFSTLWALFFVFLLEVHYVSNAICIMSTGRIILYKATLVSGILKIILSTWLSLQYGIWGIPAGTLVAHLLTNNWYAPRVLLETLELSSHQYLSSVLRPGLWFGGYIISCNIVIAKLFASGPGLPTLATGVLLSFAATLIGVYFFVLNKAEVWILKKWLRRNGMRVNEIAGNYRWLKSALALLAGACWLLFFASLIMSSVLTWKSIGLLVSLLMGLTYLIRGFDVKSVFYLPFGLLIGYFMAAYLGKLLLMLCFNNSSILLLARGVTYPLPLTPGLVNQTVFLLVASFVTFGLFYYILRCFSFKTGDAILIQSIKPIRVYWLVAFFSLLYLLLISLTIYFDIAAMGKIQAALPFKLVGILYYARRYVVLAFILLLQYLAYRDSRYVWVAAVFTVVYIAAEFILSTSKAVLFIGVVSMGLLFYLTREIRLKHFSAIVAMGSGLFLIYPLLGAIRSYEFGKAFVDGKLTISLMTSSFSAYYLHYFGEMNLSVAAGLKLFSRMTGVDMLMVILDHGTTSGAENPYLYITRAIMGHSLEVAHREAPGLLGYFYLLGGSSYMILGLFGGLSVCFLYYRILLYLKPQPVVATLFCLFFIMAFMDGAFDRNTINMLLMTGFSAALTAGLLRFIQGKNGDASLKEHSCSE